MDDNIAEYRVDRYVFDTLMADLVAHDHKPSAFLVYLTLIAAADAAGRATLSYAEIAERSGVSKRTAQDAARLLASRGLIEMSKRGVAEALEYRPLSPWRR